jgi:hypothetical protein
MQLLFHWKYLLSPFWFVADCHSSILQHTTSRMASESVAQPHQLNQDIPDDVCFY